MRNLGNFTWGPRVTHGTNSARDPGSPETTGLAAWNVHEWELR